MAVALCASTVACTGVDPAPGPKTTSVVRASTVRNGISFNGLGDNGLAVNGLHLNGIRLNGVQLSGIPLQGLRFGDLAANDQGLSSTRLWGLQMNGLTLSQVFLGDSLVLGQSLDDIDLSYTTANGLPLDALLTGELRDLLVHLAACALGDGDTVTVTDSDGETDLVLHGEGTAIDPGWADGLPDSDASHNMAECVLDRSGGTVTHLEGDYDAFAAVLTYLVECALEEDQSITYTDEDGGGHELHGSLGLAPSWANGTPSTAEAELVSACLMARTNADGTRVAISLREADGRVGASTCYEQRHYRFHEGAFMGNLFAEGAPNGVCRGSGGGDWTTVSDQAGRRCTGGDCGFSMLTKSHCDEDEEDCHLCQDVCGGDVTVDDVSGGHRVFDNCSDGERMFDNVINTYLYSDVVFDSLDDLDSVAVANRPYAIAGGDFDSDGRPDVVSLSLDMSSTPSTHVTFIGGHEDTEDQFEVVESEIDDLSAIRIVSGIFGDEDTHQDVAAIRVLPTGLSMSPDSTAEIVVLSGLGDGSFADTQRLDVGGAASDLVTEDFNGDGHVDIVAAHRYTEDLSVLHGHADGRFGILGEGDPVNRRVPAGPTPTDLVAADFDNDGEMDVVVVNADDDGVSFVRGLGDGDFLPPVRTAVGDVPIFAEPVEFNDDEFVDLIVVSDRESRVHFLAGAGNGTFELTGYQRTSSAPRAATTGDWDGDGRLDLAIICYGGAVNLYLGNGTAFDPPEYLSGRTGLGSVVAADFDGDSHADIAMSNPESGAVSFVYGLADGTLASPRIRRVGSGPRSVIAGDFTGDGHADIMAADYGHYWGAADIRITLLKGVGEGATGDPIHFPVHDRPYSLTKSDVDGDGDLDVLIARPDHSVGVAINRGEGIFEILHQLPTGERPIATAAADLNRDGLIDIAIANFGQLPEDESQVCDVGPIGGVSIFLANDSGGYDLAHTLATGNRPLDLAIDDLDRDGYGDIVVAAYCDDAISVALADGQGGYNNAVTYPAHAGPRALVITDLDNNGTLDVATANGGRSLDAGSVSLLYGDGQGGFGPPARRADEEGGSQGATDIVAAHLDGDQLIDLAVPNHYGGFVELFFGNGKHSVRARIRAGGYLTSIDTADMDDDGLLDIIVSSEVADGVIVLFASSVDSCGDGVCGTGENSACCPDDCPGVCGDRVCTGEENCASCPSDCGLCVAGCVDCGLDDGDSTPSGCGCDSTTGRGGPLTVLLIVLFGLAQRRRQSVIERHR